MATSLENQQWFIVYKTKNVHTFYITFEVSNRIYSLHILMFRLSSRSSSWCLCDTSRRKKCETMPMRVKSPENVKSPEK